jgi:hypothetical protein
MVNGTERFFARKIPITIGVQKDGFAEVIDGLHVNQLVIVESKEAVSNNQEVWVTPGVG